MTHHTSHATIDHHLIRTWVEDRGGRPARVAATVGEDGAGLLRVDYPGDHDENLEEISWDEFFAEFERSNLAFLYQDATAEGEASRFSKFVDRDSVRDQL
ncbi:MAG: hypothetical protein ACRD4B_02490 [Acidobacteriota bacterium]